MSMANDFHKHTPFSAQNPHTHTETLAHIKPGEKRDAGWIKNKTSTKRAFSLCSKQPACYGAFSGLCMCVLILFLLDPSQ